MKREISTFALVSVLFVGVIGAGAVEEGLKAGLETVDRVYPRLAAGVLTFARVGELPDGVLMRADGLELRMEDVDKLIAKQQKQLRQQLKKNAFFALEQEAETRLMLSQAKKALAAEEAKAAARKDAEIIDDYKKRLTEKVTVNDDDIVRFYKENETMFCCTPLEKVKDLLRPHVLEANKQRFVAEHIRAMGQRVDIIVSASWAKAQGENAKENAVAKARANGKATIAVFSSASCCGKDRMLGVVESLRKKYGERLNVVQVDARQEFILAARYGVYSVPTSVFFDEAGKEVLRHSGLLSEKQFDDRLSEAGLN